MYRTFWFLFYNLFIIPFSYGILKFLEFLKPNIRESFEKRTGLWNRLEESLSKREWQKPLIWFHVASAGEYLQAKPVMKRCIFNGAECLLTVMISRIF